jgi:hypothetical protein
MLTIVLIIGLIILGLGVAVLVSPSTLRKLLHHFLKREWLIPVTFLRVIVGIILLIAAPVTRWPIFIYIVGIVFILAGVSIPLIGKEKIESLANWWLEQSDMVLRVWGGIAAVLGLAMMWVGI